MLFKKKSSKPHRPSINDERDFIIWMLKYYDAPDTKMLRNFFPKSTREKAIESLANLVMQKLQEHSDGESLMNYFMGVYDTYVEFRSLIKKQKGFWRSPKELQVAFIQVLAQLITLPYFIKYRYGINIPLAEFKLPDLNDL